MPEPTTADALMTRLAALSPRDRELLHGRLRDSTAGADGGGPAAIPRDGRPLPASFLQERLWLVDQMLPGSSAYVVWFALWITGELRTDLLDRALAVVLDRHEVLRTALERVDGDLVQVVRDAVPVPLEVLDTRRSAEPRTAAERLVQDAAATGFDLARAPLLRFRLVRVAEREHLFALFLHHAITDGWSNGILLRELGVSYRALLAGAEPDLPPPSLQYADVAAWQRDRLTERRLAELLEYWEGRLRGAPDVFALPLDRPRRTDRPPSGARHPVIIPTATASRLGALARRERTTNFTVVLAGLAATLARWSGQTDVVLGSPLSGRTRPELEGVVGPMVNTVVLRLDASAGTSGQDLLRRARRVVLDAQAHADLPFERLVEALRPRRSASYHPLIQINLGVRDFRQGGLTLPDATVEPARMTDVSAAKFDLSVYLTTGDGPWTGHIEYNTELFTAATMTRLSDGLCALLSALAVDPDRPVGELPAGDLETAASPVSPPEEEPVGGADVPPRDRWERIVAQVWSQVLGLARVGAHDDFFAVGGHSMAGMLVAERIQQMTGRRLGLATIFRNPTVERLAAALRGTDAGTGAPFVVPLRSGGERRPLFFAPPAVGELALYFDLARNLGGHRPLYGLQADGFFQDGDPGDLSLIEQAARYAGEIVLVCPDGPYHLCGFSAAGRLAVAVADQLVRTGHPVGAVILLDSAPYGDVAPDPELATVLSRWLEFAPPRQELAALGRADQIARTLAAGRASGNLPPTLGPAEFENWCRRLEFGARALAGHGPLTYPGTVTLLVRADRTRDIAAEWADIPIGALHTVPVAVDAHLSFIEGPSVPEVAGLVAELLTAAETGRAEGRRR